MPPECPNKFVPTAAVGANVVVGAKVVVGPNVTDLEVFIGVFAPKSNATVVFDAVDAGAPNDWLLVAKAPKEFVLIVEAVVVAGAPNVDTTEPATLPKLGGGFPVLVLDVADPKLNCAELVDPALANAPNDEIAAEPNLEAGPAVLLDDPNENRELPDDLSPLLLALKLLGAATTAAGLPKENGDCCCEEIDLMSAGFAPLVPVEPNRNDEVLTPLVTALTLLEVSTVSVLTVFVLGIKVKLALVELEPNTGAALEPVPELKVKLEDGPELETTTGAIVAEMFDTDEELAPGMVPKEYNPGDNAGRVEDAVAVVVPMLAPKLNGEAIVVEADVTLGESFTEVIVLTLLEEPNENGDLETCEITL